MTYICRDGITYGPYDQERLQELISSRQIVASDLFWCEGMSKWQAVGKMKVTSAPEVAPENFLLLSILVTLLCCPLLGIPAIFQAAKVDKLVALGNLPEARAASRTAFWLCAVSILFVILFMTWMTLTREY